LSGRRLAQFGVPHLLTNCLRFPGHRAHQLITAEAGMKLLEYFSVGMEAALWRGLGYAWSLRVALPATVTVRHKQQACV
jgi:hypothetical protein